jgi:oligogalacturonide lyase
MRIKQVCRNSFWLLMLLLAPSLGQQPERVRVFMLGDSTMADKPLADNPERGWGQLFPMLFTDRVEVKNHAVNGRSTKSFIDEKRWEVVLAQLQRGDWVFIQFGHNDQKSADLTRYAAPHTDYRANLARFVSETRAKGAQAVLLTPVMRRRFDAQGKFFDTHGEYPAAVRSLAKELNVPLIDLHQTSRALLERHGAEGSKKLFLWIEPGQYKSLPEGKKDDTHFSESGATQIAQLVAADLRRLRLDLAQHLKPAPEPPLEWIEPETGHRVVRLSREPGTASLYFHQNAYTASGDKLVVTTPKGIATIELKTGKLELLIEGRASHLVVGRKTRQVFYLKDGAVYATHLDTKATREIVRNAELRSGSGFAINADETLLGGSMIEGGAQPPPNPVPPNQRGDSYPGKGQMMEQRLAARLPMALYTINIKSGEVKPFYRATDWLNHVQFSPTDLGLMMFCHEGPWHKVDRIWTIRVDGTQKRLMHKRTMEMEIAGHEFFSADGKTVWYDLQTPKGKEFWLAGVELATGKTTRYKVPREQWSVHFNIAPNGELFAGDGGGPSSVAAPGNGQWIYLFTPQTDGSLRAERLVNLAQHDYRLEPNVTFTPDMKWIVFRSNLHGVTHVYAVEVVKK